MRLHPREQMVMLAEAELSLLVTKFFMERDLTDGEVLRVVASVLGGKLQSMAKYMIRDERHGNTETPGGLAGDGEKSG